MGSNLTIIRSIFNTLTRWYTSTIATIANAGMNTTGYPEIVDLPFILRQPSKSFTGSRHKKQLSDISSNYAAHLHKFNKKPPVYIEILHGQGGCGKTEIVTQYLWHHWRMYEHVFIINATSAAFINYSLKILLEKTSDNPGELIGYTPENIRQKSLEWLRKHTKWLLVFEEAVDPSIVRHILPNNPPLYNGHVLITTRLSDGWDNWYTDWCKKTCVQELSCDDSAIFLLRTKGSMNGGGKLSDDEAKNDLEKMQKEKKNDYKALMWLGGSKALHGVPIALLQAIQYISTSQITFSRYKELFESNNTEVLADLSADQLEGWLKANKLDAKYAPLLRNEFRGDLFSSETLEEDENLDERLRRNIGMPEKDIERFKNAYKNVEKAEFSQIENPDKDNVLSTWKLSFEMLCDNKVGAEFLQLCCCLSPCIEIAMLVEGASFLSPGDLRSFCIGRGPLRLTEDETNTHAKIIDLTKKLRKYSFSSNMIGQSSVNSNTHPRSLARYGSFTVHHIVQIAMLKLATREEKILSLNNAIRMLENLFPKLEEVHADQVEAIYDETVGGRHSVIASHTLALSRQIQTIEKDNIQGLRDVSPLFLVVGVYFRRMGQAEDAKVLYKELRRLSVLQKPVREGYLGEVMRNLGKVNFDLRKFKEAEDNFKESIALFTNVHGKEHPKVFYAMQGLGRVLHNTMETDDQRRELEEHLLETLQRKKNYFRNRESEELDHYSIAHANQQLGRFYQKIGEYKQAHEYFFESLETKKKNWQRKYGTTETVDIAVDQTNVARNYLLQSGRKRNLVEAEKLLLEAYHIKRKMMLPTNESYQLAAYYLAVLHDEKKDYKLSKKYYDKIVMTDLKDSFKTWKKQQIAYKDVYPSEKTFWL